MNIKDDVDIILESWIPNRFAENDKFREWYRDHYPEHKTLKDIVDAAISLVKQRPGIQPSDAWIFRIWPDTEHEVDFEVYVGDDGDVWADWSDDLADWPYENEQFEDAINQIKSILKK